MNVVSVNETVKMSDNYEILRLKNEHFRQLMDLYRDLNQTKSKLLEIYSSAVSKKAVMYAVKQINNQ